MRGKTYTKEENYFLIENYSKYGIEYCMNFLNKSKSSIKHKANRLNLRINRVEVNSEDKKVRIFYTKEEIDFLSENYPIHGAEYCGKHLNKSYSSILSKVSKLKIKIIYKTAEEIKESKRVSNQKWLDANPEYQKLYGENYRESNPDKVKEAVRKCIENNPEKRKETNRKYSKTNSKKINEYGKNYRETHKKEKYIKNTPEKKKENRKIAREKERKEKPHIKSWRGMLYNCLVRMGKKKEGDTIDILGYSAIDLKNHMISLFTEGMSWDNHGEWHIDHIKPVSSFNRETPMNIVNALRNLQPLWETTREINGIIYEGNLNKGNKLKK